jgi:hypothetical protein
VLIHFIVVREMMFFLGEKELTILIVDLALIA